MSPSKIKVRQKEAPPLPKAPTAIEPTTGERLFKWAQAERKRLYVLGAMVAVVAGGIWFVRTAKIRKERFAAVALDQARTSVDAGNLQLAVSDLSRVASEYEGTSAGSEAALLLGRIRLQLGQTNDAIAELRSYIAQEPDQEFLFQADGLLGTALEQSGQFAEASTAFENAATASRFALVSHQFLLDAGRTAKLAGDTQRASTIYDRVIQAEEDDPAAATEAKLRKAELTNS
jgi:tetratricopeptide (TPR) repeat protein